MAFRRRETYILGEAAIAVHYDRDVLGDLTLHDLFQQTLLVGLVGGVGYDPRDLVLDAMSPFSGFANIGVSDIYLSNARRDLMRNSPVCFISSSHCVSFVLSAK
jgi:hypothetical protein